VNPVTNKIYVANQGSANVTVIDGATNGTTTVAAGSTPAEAAVNPVTNKVYVTNYYGANMTVIDGATNGTTTVAAGTYPLAVAVNPVTNKVYVTNSDNSRVTVIDGSRNLTVPVTTGNSPNCAAVNPVTATIYVSNYGSNTVTVINGSTHGTTTIPVGTGPLFMALNPVTNKIFIPNCDGNNVTVMDGATNGTTTVGTGTYPMCATVNPVTNRVYVSCYNGGRVSVIDGTTLDTASVVVGSGPLFSAVNAATNRVYVPNSLGNSVSVIDGATNTVSSITVGSNPMQVAVNPITNRVYVPNRTTNTVSVISGATDSVIATVTVGVSPYGVAVNAVTNRIYVANLSANTVSVIDGATNSVIGTLTAGASPRYVTVDEVRNKTYVGNSGANTVTVIDGATNSTTTVTVGTWPWWPCVNPVTGRVYAPSVSGGSVSVIIPEYETDAKLLAAVQSPGTQTTLSQPAVSGKAVSRSTPNRNKMYKAFQKRATSQRAWDPATTTAGNGTDSLSWSWSWGSDSLIQGENFLCVSPLDSGTGTTNNLGLGTPFAGNLLVHPLYRLSRHDVGVTRILVPTGTIDSGSTLTPACSVYNYGNTTDSYTVMMRIGIFYYLAGSVSGHAPGTYAYVAFPTRTVTARDTVAVACSTMLGGDMWRLNDRQTGSVIVTGGGGGGAGWTAKSPMPTGAKAIKDGGWLAYDAGTARIYATRGQKQPDFFAYNPAKDSWKALAPWLPGTEAKLPQKGSVGCADGDGNIYATKGNSTSGFWKYDANANAWTQKKDIPLGLSNKKVKGGTDMVFVKGTGHDTGYVYLLKGYKNEFYRYNTATDSWQTLIPAPVGSNGKWDKGSWLVAQKAPGPPPKPYTIYAFKAKYMEFYSYSTETGSWSASLAAMPIAGSAGSKKSKDGGCADLLNDYIYALKGGNTREFWKYTIAANSWTEKETIPTGSFKKKVKAGADIAAVGSVLYATKGNKSNELWKYTPGALLFDVPRRDGVEAERLANGDCRLAIAPNPLASGFATLSFTRPLESSNPRILLSVYDVTGQRVMARTLVAGRSGIVSLDLRHLSNGVYLVKLASEGFAGSQKLVVQR
jgi:YVTN family beta-propeller protein